jgi:hypothetical protein
MRAAGKWRFGVASLVVMATSAGRGAAQATPGTRWTLEGNQGSYCIWYLADPDVAKLLVPSETVLTPAGTGAGLHPLLMRYVRDEPRLAQWIPGSICIGFFDRVTAEGKTLAQSRPDRPVIIAINSLAAQDARGIAGAGRYLLDVMTDQGALARAAAELGVNMDGIKIVRRPRSAGDDPEVLIDVAGVQINWSGHAVRDSSVGTTRSVSFGYAGRRNTNGLMVFESTPATTRLMVGALEVAGRNTLAKALKTSPARAIGPQEFGGTTFLTFQQATKR